MFSQDKRCLCLCCIVHTRVLCVLFTIQMLKRPETERLILKHQGGHFYPSYNERIKKSETSLQLLCGTVRAHDALTALLC